MFKKQSARSSAPRPLLLRFRRPFSLIGIVDDTVAVYRGQWLRFLGSGLFSAALAVALTGGVAAVVVQAGAVDLAAGALAVLAVPAALAGSAEAAAAVAGWVPRGAVVLPTGASIGIATLSLVGAAVAALVYLAWAAAAVLVTDGALRGERPSVVRCVAQGLFRAPVLFLGFVYLGIAAVLLVGIALVPYLVLRSNMLLVHVASLTAILMWAVRKDIRTPVVRWLIVLTLPFGLPIYFFTSWSLFVEVATLERVGPLKALRRSEQLIARRWVRVFAVGLVVGLLVCLMQAVPGVLAGFLTPGGGTAALNAGSVAGGLVGALLFAALGPVARTLTFVALRNDREGVDIGSRLASLQDRLPPARTLVPA